MSKLVKQRKESMKSFIDGGRSDLASAEQEECDHIISYLPKQMSEEELIGIIEETIASTDAKTVKDMGKVISVLRNSLAGKADMGVVGGLVKKRLTGK